MSGAMAHSARPRNTRSITKLAIVGANSPATARAFLRRSVTPSMLACEGSAPKARVMGAYLFDQATPRSKSDGEAREELVEVVRVVVRILIDRLGDGVPRRDGAIVLRAAVREEVEDVVERQAHVPRRPVIRAD